eukprot:COSAG05_NODE_10049_length_586_cov_0.882957_1_plen_145_part_10
MVVSMLPPFALALLLTATAGVAPSSSGPMYYKLGSADLKAKDWPAHFVKYTHIVADPGFSSAEIAQIRRDLPGRRLIAYTCMSWAYVKLPCTNCTAPRGTNMAGCSGCPGPRCVDRLDSAGQPYWKDSYNVRNLHDGKAVCPFKG